mgnify:CR=1 FL=1
MKNISIGIMLGVVMCMIILTYYPLSETEQACQYCDDCWWFELAEGGE